MNNKLEFSEPVSIPTAWSLDPSTPFKSDSKPFELNPGSLSSTDCSGKSTNPSTPEYETPPTLSTSFVQSGFTDHPARNLFDCLPQDPEVLKMVNSDQSIFKSSTRADAGDDNTLLLQKIMKLEESVSNCHIPKKLQPRDTQPDEDEYELSRRICSSEYPPQSQNCAQNQANRTPIVYLRLPKNQ